MIKPTPVNKRRTVRMARLVPLREATRDFDVEFWQKLGPGAILTAACELAATAEKLRNPHADLRIQRGVAVLKRLRS